MFIRPFLEEACLPGMRGSAGLEWDVAVLEPCLSLSWHQPFPFFLGQEEEAAFSGGFLKHCVVPGR